MPEQRRPWLAATGAVTTLGGWATVQVARADGIVAAIVDAAVGAVSVGAAIAVSRSTPATSRLLLLNAAAWWCGGLFVPAVYLHRSVLAYTIWTAPLARARTRPRTLGLIALAGVYGFERTASPDPATAVYGIGVLVVAALGWTVADARTRRLRRITTAGAAVLAAGCIGVTLLRVADLAASTVALASRMYGVTIAVTIVVLASACRTRSPVHLADLVLDLDATRAESLRRQLARALSDPHVRVVFDDEAAGHAGRLPTDAADRSSTVVELEHGRRVTIVHDRSLLDDPELVAAVRTVAALSATNASLDQHTRRRLALAEASRHRLLTVEDGQRRQLADRVRATTLRRLHPVASIVECAEAAAVSPAMHGALQAVRRQLEATRSEVEAIASGLHPSDLHDGLVSGIRALTARSPLAVDLIVSSSPTLDPDEISESVSIALYLCCSEALANVAKHARTDRATVTLELARTMRLTVADSGIGGARAVTGSGLAGLADRMSALDGSLDVRPRDGGGGTVVVATVPLRRMPAT